jgi:hypothetical protein
MTVVACHSKSTTWQGYDGKSTCILVLWAQLSPQAASKCFILHTVTVTQKV